MPTSEARPYVINKLPNNTAEILIYDRIGDSFWEEGISAKKFSSDLRDLGAVKRIDVRINSPGGSVFDGLAIYNALDQHKATVHVHIDGIAFSMASVIAMVGTTVNMASNALMMIHNPQGAVQGDASQVRAYADLLDKTKGSIMKAYVKKTGKTEDEISALMDAETWFSADEAEEMGFADAVTEQLAVAASVDLSQLPFGMVAPANVLDRFARSPVTNEEEENMSDEIKRIAATLQELKALPGADNDFVVEQLQAEATLVEATNALNAKLVAELAEARKVANDAEKAAVENATKQQQQVENASESQVAEGVPAFNKNKTPGNAGAETSQQTAVDFETEFEKRRAQGMSATAAWKDVYNKFPQFKQVALDSHRETRGVPVH